MKARSVVLGILCVMAGNVATMAGDWDELPTSTSPEARSGHRMVTVGDTVYLFGGMSGAIPTTTYHNDLWRWDDDARDWVLVSAATPLVPRKWHGMAAAEGRLYIGYGWADGYALDDFWEYDPATDSWIELNVIDGPDAHVLGGMCSLGNGKIFAGGGYQSNFTDYNINVYIIDVSRPRKTRGVSAHHIESLNPGRYGHVTGATPDGNPILVAGYREGDTAPSNDVMVWDPDPYPWGEWHSVTPTRNPVLARGLAASAQYLPNAKALGWDDIIIIVGGESSDKVAQSTDVQYLNVVTWELTYGDPMPVALSDNAAAILPTAGGPTYNVLTYGGVTSAGSPIDWTFDHTSDADLDVGGTIYVTAAAHAGGVGSSMWVTDLEAHNGGASTATCTASLLVKNQANPDPDTIDFSVPPGQALRVPDVILDRFGEETVGALRIDYQGTDLSITTRTYNLLGEGNPEGLPAGATFGQFIPGVTATDAIGPGEQVRLMQLAKSADETVGFRTNIGFVNTSGAAATVTVGLFAGDGQFLGPVTEVLQPYEYDQITNIYNQVTSEDVQAGYAVVSTDTVGASFLTYASVVDNPTNDPTYVAPQMRVGDFGGVITASAHTAGAGGTQWRTDLEVHNPTGEAIMGGVFLLPRDEATTAPLMQLVNVPSGESRSYPDALDSMFLFEGAAALRCGPALADLMITSRTYNLLSEGNPLGYPAGATFGQFIPLVSIDQAVGFGGQALLIQLTRSADETVGFRTNIGVLNVTEELIDVVVELYLADGTSLGTIDVQNLGAWESRQLNRVFNQVGAGDVADGFAIVRTTSEAGDFFTYASVVDNITGDPIYIPGM